MILNIPSHTLVTGGASGIGAETARALVGLGGRVTILDLNRDAGEALAAELGPGADFGRADICDEAALKAALARAETRGPVDGLVTCAGMAQKTRSIEALTRAEFDKVMQTHVMGMFLCCQLFGSAMAARGKGAIVNVSSVLSIRPGPVHAYGAAKAAIDNVTQTLAAEWGRRGVRVNSILPGWVDTPLVREQEKAGRDLSRIRDFAALGRLIDPKEVSNVICFLLSDAASAMTGARVVVDAGVSLMGGWAPYPEFDRFGHGATQL